MESRENDIVRIYNNGAKERTKIITSDSDFFKGEIIVKITDEVIEITKPTLDYRGKSLKSYKQHNTYRVTVTNDILNAGTYEVDNDESNEDKMVIYYKEPI